MLRAAVDLIKEFEGLEIGAYRDAAGVWTIGYGHTRGFRNGRFHAGSVISEAQADDLIADDLAIAGTALEKWAHENAVPLNENQRAALLSLIFNIGFGAFIKSTAARRLIAGDYFGAAEAMTWWNKARVDGALMKLPGLVRRREAERALFLKRPKETPNNPDSAGYWTEHDTRCAAVESPSTLIDAILKRIGL